MNLPAVMLVLGLAPALFCQQSAAQGSPGTAVLTLVSNSAPVDAAGKRLPRSFLGRQPGFASTNAFPRWLPLQTNAAPRSPRLFLGKAYQDAQLKPGVYETWPYTCIVVVPGPHPDDKSMVPSTGDGMPVIKPDLRFIPRKP